MVTPLVILCSTLVLFLGYTWFRRIEERRGARFFEARRAAWDMQAQELWTALVMGGIPLSWRKQAAVVTHQVSHDFVHLMVTALRAAERPLARLSYRMRVSAPKGSGAPVSQFLKTITPEKSRDFQEKSV